MLPPVHLPASLLCHAKVLATARDETLAQVVRLAVSCRREYFNATVFVVASTVNIGSEGSGMIEAATSAELHQQRQNLETRLHALEAEDARREIDQLLSGERAT